MRGREPPLVLRQADDEDVAAEGTRHLRRQQPHGSRSGDEHAIARGDARGIAQAVADARQGLDQHGGVLVQPFRNAMEVDRGHDEPRREGAVHEGADRPPVGTEIDAAVAAPLARSAGRVVRLGDDRGTEPRAVDTGTERRDTCRHLVTHGYRRPRGELARFDVQVGSADPGPLHVEQHLARSRRSFLAFDEAHVASTRRELGQPFHAPALRIRLRRRARARSRAPGEG